MLGRRVMLGISIVSLSACTLMTDLDGFSGDFAADEVDPSVEPQSDASAPAPATREAGTDASEAGTDAARPPAECAEDLLAGSKSFEAAGEDFVPRGKIDVYGHVAARAGRAACLWVYIERVVDGGVVLGVWASADAKPGKLLAQAAITEPKRGWNAARIEPFDVTASAVYWLGVGPLGSEIRVQTHFAASCGDLHLRAINASSDGRAPHPFPGQHEDWKTHCNGLWYLAPLRP